VAASYGRGHAAGTLSSVAKAVGCLLPAVWH